MTLSEDTHPYPEIPPCPPWCRADHTRQKTIHESAVAYAGSNAALFTAYARSSHASAAPSLHLWADIATSPDGITRTASLEFHSPEDMDAFGTLLESLALAGPEAVRTLAAQARAAAAVIAGEAS